MIISKHEFEDRGLRIEDRNSQYSKPSYPQSSIFHFLSSIDNHVRQILGSEALRPTSAGRKIPHSVMK